MMKPGAVRKLTTERQLKNWHAGVERNYRPVSNSERSLMLWT